MQIFIGKMLNPVSGLIGNATSICRKVLKGLREGFEGKDQKNYDIRCGFFNMTLHLLMDLKISCLRNLIRSRTSMT